MDVMQMRVKELVSAKGVKGTWVDKQLGRPKNWFSKVTTGIKRVEVQDVADLAHLLSIPVTDFFMPIMSTKSEKKKGA